MRTQAGYELAEAWARTDEVEVEAGAKRLVNLANLSPRSAAIKRFDCHCATRQQGRVGRVFSADVRRIQALSIT